MTSTRQAQLGIAAVLALLAGEAGVLIAATEMRGWPWAVGYLVVGTASGVLLYVAALQFYRRRLRQARDTGRHLDDDTDVSVFIAMTMLFVCPGMLSDVLAFVVLLPPVRRHVPRIGGSNSEQEDPEYPASKSAPSDRADSTLVH